MTRPTVEQVYVIFKTHLDVGFTDLSETVVQDYFTNYRPKAMALSERLRQLGRPERFLWTTGSWLIYHYLEQATPAESARVEQPSWRATWPGTRCRSPRTANYLIPRFCALACASPKPWIVALARRHARPC